MKTLFKADKKEIALNWIAQRISMGAQNSAIAIIRLHTICQNPENNSDPKELIDKWAVRLFHSEFNSSHEDWSADKFITPEIRSTIEYLFFYYYVSFTPLLFLNKNFKISKFQGYKWTKNDFDDLQDNMLEHWFLEEYNHFENNNLKKSKLFESKVRNVIRNISAVAKAKQSLFKNDDKLESLLSTSHIKPQIRRLLPEFNHPFQSDLYELYSHKFMESLPSALMNMENDFYVKGNYLYSFFKWSPTLFNNK